MDVLPALESEVTSMWCLNRLRHIRQTTGNAAGAREFRERFDAAEQALDATCNLPREDRPPVNNEPGNGYETLAGALHWVARRHPVGRVRWMAKRPEPQMAPPEPNRTTTTQ
jgi:hypothetical protein